MGFQHPLFLLLLVPLAALAWAHHRRNLSQTDRRRFPALLLAMTCLVAGLANPYWTMTAEKEVVRGVDYVVLLDVSQSMFCLEGRQRRVDRAIEMLNSLMPRLAGSSAGVVYFAGDARVGCPLTPDLSALPLFLETVAPGMTSTMGTRSSSLPEAIEEILSAREAQRKTVGLLFSDGEFADHGRSLASWMKDRRDFTLFTVLCGSTRSQVPELDLDLPHPGAFSVPDPKQMADLASSGGGAAFDLSHAPLNQIERALLSSVQESVSAGRQVPDYNARPFLVLCALLLLFYRIYPYVSASGTLRATAQATLLLLLCVSIGMKEKGPSPAEIFKSALQDMKDKKYDDATRKLQELRKDGASEEVEIALGNVAFAKKNYDESIKRYQEALRINPTNDRARWNWEVALKRQSNQGPPPPPPQGTPPPPQPIPQDISALLKYFDQQEKQQIQQNNQPKESSTDFAW